MCKYVVSRSICMAQVGDVMGLWTKHNYIYDHTNGQVIQAVIFLMSKINSYGAFILKDPVSTS